MVKKENKKKPNKNEYEKLVRRTEKFIIGSFIFGIIIFFLVALFGGFFKVVGLIESSNLWIYSFAFLAALASILIRCVKWVYYLRKMKINISLKDSITTYLSMWLMNITPAKLGRYVVAYTIAKISESDIAAIMPAITMDTFTDTIGFGIFVIVFGIYFRQYLLYMIIIDAVLLLPYIFFVNDWFYKILKNFLSRFKHKYVVAFKKYGDQYFRTQSILNDRKVYFYSLLITLPADFLTASALYISLLALGIKESLIGTVFISSAAQLFWIVSGLPGGIGIAEATLITFLENTDKLSPLISSAATIMARTATLWFPVILGLIFFLYTTRYWRDNKKGKEKN